MKNGNREKINILLNKNWRDIIILSRASALKCLGNAIKSYAKVEELEAKIRMRHDKKSLILFNKLYDKIIRIYRQIPFSAPCKEMILQKYHILLLRGEREIEAAKHILKHHVCWSLRALRLDIISGQALIKHAQLFY
jgi:head-tail adaptor